MHELGACYTGTEESVVTSDQSNPRSFSLLKCYPNPFNPSTTIEYSLATPGEVTISVFNIKGQLVDVIQSGFFSSGYYTVEWAPDDLPSGIYFEEMKAGSFRDVMKVSFVK